MMGWSCGAIFNGLGDSKFEGCARTHSGTHTQTAGHAALPGSRSIGRVSQREGSRDERPAAKVHSRIFAAGLRTDARGGRGRAGSGGSNGRGVGPKKTSGTRCGKTKVCMGVGSVSECGLVSVCCAYIWTTEVWGLACGQA